MLFLTFSLSNLEKIKFEILFSFDSVSHLAVQSQPTQTVNLNGAIVAATLRTSPISVEQLSTNEGKQSKTTVLQSTHLSFNCLY